MCRNLALTATAIGLILAGPALAGSKDKDRDAPAAPANPAASAAAPARPPPKATPAQRAEAERLDPLARAAFWAREVELDGRDVEAGGRLAAALRTMGRNEEAAGAAQVVLVIDPANRTALLELARAYLAAGKGFFAIDPLRRLQAQAPGDWKTWSLMGVAYDQVSRPEDAVDAWKKALALAPENPAVLSNLAMHYAAAGQVTEAEGLLRRAAAQTSATIQVRQNLVLVLGMQGKFAEAEKLVREDLPPEIANNNLAYLRAAAGSPESRSWKALQGAQAAAN